MSKKLVLGIDIGGTGMKGGLVDVKQGVMVGERFRLDTPKPAKPDAVLGVLKQILDHFQHEGKIGAAYPGVIKKGVIKFVANLDQDWVGVDADTEFSEVVGQPVRLINDADAAGIAEVHSGAAKGQDGVVLMLTLGTGIGCGLFIDGKLVPNTELGHVELAPYADAEEIASRKALKALGLSVEEWAAGVDKYLNHINMLISPDLIVLGGGGSKHWDSFGHLLTVPTEVRPAKHRNQSGIIGAAIHAHTAAKKK